MKNLLNFCLPVFLVVTLLAPLTASAQDHVDGHFPFLAKVSKESVNVRAGDNINFEKIDKLQKGTKVIVLGQRYEWYKIQPPATSQAYIRADYLKLREGGIVAELTGDRVNVRAAPSSDASSLGELAKGTLVKVVEQSNGWCRIEPVAGMTAWVHTGFFEKISDEVPASLIIQPVQWQPTPAGVSAPTVLKDVSVQGKVEPLSGQADARYELTVDGKPVYYLQDMPQLDAFCDAVVNIEGSIVPGLQGNSVCPLVHITKISLVL